MQYALSNGVKTEAQKGKIAVCIGCGQQVIAKCGQVKIHHWAHVYKAKCDSWWEGETIWHRTWKENFAENCREISFFDEKLQEYHRADIHTATGITIEFQNSPISTGELKAREIFYPKLIWVVNGAKFKGFKILKVLPHPNNPGLDQFEFCNTEHLSMVRKTDVLSQRKNPEILNFYHADLKHIPVTSDFYSFSWKHPHQAWLNASCPVFIDFGGHFLYRFRKRYQVFENYNYLQMISKMSFLNKYANNL